MKTLEVKLAVNALIRKNNKVLLGKRSSESKFFPNYWCIPGGKVNKGEELIVAVKREIREETGLNINIVKLLEVSKRFHKNHFDVLFDFEGIPTNLKLKVTEKLIELKWFSKREIKKIKLTQRDRKILEKYL